MNPCDDIWKDCERLGEGAVRAKFAAKAWSVPASAGCVEHWLSQKVAERAAAADAKRDAREDESLALARSQASIAERAATAADRAAKAAFEQARWAKWAAILAAIAAVIAAQDKIIALISGQP